MNKVLLTAAVALVLAGGAAQARDNTAAVLGGVAVGAVGGAILGSALSGRPAAAAPVYVQPAPPPPPTVVEVVRPVAASPLDDQAYGLRMACNQGNRNACIRFGVLIGKHQERVAAWRRTHPDYFSFDE